MNFLDIIIIIVLIYGIIMGMLKGFVSQAFSMIGVVIGIYFSILYVNDLSSWLYKGLDLPMTYARPISYVVLFCVVLIITNLLAKVLDKSVKILLISWLNKTFGGLLGLVKYALLLSVILHVFQAFDNNFKVIKKEQINNSLLYKPIYRLVPKLLPYVETDFLKIKIN